MPARRPRLLVVSWVGADLLSILGTRLAALAVPWLVLTTTGSATRTGLVAAAELAPMVLARALSGPVIDRLGAVRTAVLADAASAVAAVAVPLLWLTDQLSFPALLVLVALLGAARGPGDSAKQTMLPELAAASAQPLERMTGVGGTTERLASTVGLALGGVVVALVGGADALLVTAAGFGASALLGLVVLRPALGRRRPATADRHGYLTELREGFAGLRRDQVLVGIVVMLTLTNAIDQAYFAVLAPAWVVEHGHGSQTLGLLFAGFMLTAVVGSVAATAWSLRLPRLPFYVGGFLLAGLPRFLVLVPDLPLAAVLVVTAVTGFGAGFLNPILGAVTLERVPAAVRGRVMALVGATTMALMPLGGLLGGVLTDRVGLTGTLVSAGLAYLVITMLPALLPSWRGFGQRPDPAAAEPEQVTVPAEREVAAGASRA